MILIDNNFNTYKLVEFGAGQIKIQNPYIVPNVGAIARQMTGGSQIMMIIKRLLSLKPLNIVRFGLNNILFAPSILKMDFAAGIKVLCELEILKALEREKSNHFVLHNQMVDMALAFNNKKILNNFSYLAKKYNFVPGIITYNIEALIKHLSNNLGISKQVIIYTPLNQVKGSVVLEYLNNSSLKVVDIKD